MPKRKAHAEADTRNEQGQKLRALREAVGLSQGALAKRLQISGKWDCDVIVLGRVERGQRTLTDIEIGLILKALNKRWADLDE